MSRQLLMLGGGHAHLPLLEAAPEFMGSGHRVTLVSPEPVHYYSGMGPGMLGGMYDPEEIRFPIRSMAEERGVRWVRDKAARIRPADRVVELAGGGELAYDVLSVNTGSSVAPTVTVDADVPRTGPRVFTVKPISQMLELRHYLELRLSRGRGRTATAERSPENVVPGQGTPTSDPVGSRNPGDSRESQVRIVVVGGGPAAMEAAANIRRYVASLSSAADEATRIDLICGRALLPGFPARAERIAIRALEARGVTVRTAEHVRRISSEGIVTRLGAEPADVVLLATGVVPSRLFADSQLPLGHDGSLAVDEYLHCLGYDTIYGAGDCIWFTPRPLARAGVFAVRESPILVHNVRQALAGRFDRLKRFSPGGGYMLLLNLGDGTGLFWRRVLGVQLAYRGRSAWRLKDRIDRAFMHRYGSEADRGNQH